MKEEFRIRPGQVAFTYQVAGTDDATLLLQARELTQMLDRVAPAISSYGLGYEGTVAAFAHAFRERPSEGLILSEILQIGAWLTMNHPCSGMTIRAAVAEALRRDQPAHLTMRIADGAITFGLGSRFVDLHPIVAAAGGALDPLLVLRADSLPSPEERRQ